jgi:8-oxo-dGTP diphosphatase
MSRDERPEETAQRKLTEKTGVGAVYLEQLQTYGDPHRNPRGWWTVDDLPTLALDHRGIIADGADRLRGKLWTSKVSVGLLPERFTPPRAPGVFEAISGVRNEPSNFQRAVARSGPVQATRLVAKGGSRGPGELCEFVSRQPAWSLRRSRPVATPGTALSREAARR